MALGGAPVDPYGSLDESGIDTWWSTQTPGDSATWDAMFKYIMMTVVSSIGEGHTVEHGPNDADDSYELKISGDTINKTWN